MNLRPPRPEHGALPSCATSRWFILRHAAHLRCFLPAIQYLIVLPGRVLHPDLFIFNLSFGITFGNPRYQVLSQNNTQLFCSAECYIPIFLYFVCHSGVSFGNQRYPKLLPRRGVLFPKLPVSLNSTNVDTVQNLTLMCPQDFVIYNLDSIDTLQILSPKILLSNETNLLTC